MLGKRSAGGKDLADDRAEVTGRLDAEGALGAPEMRTWQRAADDGETCTGTTDK